MRKGIRLWGAASLALVLAMACSDDEQEPATTTTGAGGTGAGGTGGTAGAAGCPDFPPDATCGADHSPDQNRGPCDQEGQYCDFSDTSGG